MTTPKTIRRTFRVGRFTCELSVPPIEAGGLTQAACEWSPSVPHRLSGIEQGLYRAGRDKALASILAELTAGLDQPTTH